MQITKGSLRHGWGLALVVALMMGVVVALGFVLTDRQHLAAMIGFAAAVFLALMVKVVAAGLRGAPRRR